MPKYAANPEPVQRIKTLADLVAYLRDELGWPISPDGVTDDLTFDWSADELRLAGGQATRLRGGTVRQLRPFVPGQPWGIFLVEFADTQVYRTSLRQILRGLVPNRRRDPSLQSWQQENLLFICATADYERFTFAHFKGDQVHRAKLATFGWRKGSAYLRTLIEHNLPYLAWPKDDGADSKAWQSEWARAFDKEPVTKKFFADFNNTFRKVGNDIANRHSRWSKETVEREAQTLLNRLLFLYFIQRKGWLNRDRQYLVNQFRECYRQDPTGNSFLKDFLQPLFVKLSTKGPQADIPGHDLPFLNGGLFADEYGSEQRDDEVRRHHELKAGNDTFQHIFDDLLEAYNFTVREDTPLDVDVAIDPEMLGKIFESLVLQLEQSEVGGKSSRYDTGSYYTPRPIVHYLCRDALAAWLADQPPFAVAQTSQSAVSPASKPAGPPNLPAAQTSPASTGALSLSSSSGGEGRGEEAQHSRIENLLALDASQGLDETARATLNSLLTPDQARALADALQELRACDLAVGSGAFPVALLHELVNVARLAETRARGKDPATNDPRWLFDTKTRFIERVLYGVDIQARAIEICKLRLWLSLVVDYPLDVDVDTCEKQSFRDSLKRLPALPNLDFKIRRANSLIDTIHGEPVPLGKLHASDQARVVLNKLTTAKREFYRADAVPEKRKLRFAIYAALAELAQIELTVARNELGLLPDPENAGKVAELDQGQKAMAKVLGQIRDARKMKAADQDDALERIREFFDDEKKPTFVWQLDFAEVFHREKNPGFDLIIGNPPYVRIQVLNQVDPDQVAFFKEHYYSASKGNYDLYVIFVEHGLQLLQPRGQLAFILPHKFFNAQYGEPLRELISKAKHLRHVVHFGDQQIFPGATNYVCLLFLAKASAGECRWARADSLLSWLETQRAPETGIATGRVTAAEWNFSVGKGAALFEKLQRMPVKLGDVAERIFQGLVTGADPVYVLRNIAKDRFFSEATEQEHRLETDLMHPLCKGSLDVRRYHIGDLSRSILFPYRMVSGRATLIPCSEFKGEFPNAWQYLQTCREILEARERGKWKHERWYAFGRSQNLSEMEQPKILTPSIAASACFTLDQTDFYYFMGSGGGGGGGYGITLLRESKLRLKYVLALLNSRLLDYFLKRTSSAFSGGYFAYNRQYIEPLPIRPINFTDPADRAEYDALVALVDRILKAKRADGAADTAALEREIDERVYRLYGLTADEIKIVEEACP
jgi:methylase of polypeptide subunit release factors